MKKSGALIALLALIAIGGGAFALTRSKKNVPVTPTSPPATVSNPTTTEPPAPSSTPTTPEASTNTASTVITYNDNGFSPGSTTIKPGGSVTVNNNSSRTLDFASDPHPVHTDNRELNIGSIAAGSSKTFTVTKTGTWGFHNHLRAGDTGKLLVE